MARLINIISPLEKVFHDSKPDFEPYAEYSAMVNEKSSFQLLFSAEKGERVELSANIPNGVSVSLSLVEEIPAGFVRDKNADDYYIPGVHPAYPDLLRPLSGSSFTAPKTGLCCVWARVCASRAGSFELEFTCADAAKALRLDVIGCELPAQELIYTNWFHTDCLMSYYGFEAFSPEYWRCTENFLRRAVQNGMNCVLTPLFTPPLDTKPGGERPTVQLVGVVKNGSSYEFSFEQLDKWVDMCRSCGIEYFEMSHLFTQWGARHAPKIIARVNGREKRIFGWSTSASGKRYRLFLEQFASAFKKYADKKGITERCLIHVSDEPAKRQLRAYQKAADTVKRNFDGFKIVDALSDYSFYQNGAVRCPIPATDHIEPFIGNVPELWAYYCSAQGKKYVSNRFFAMPSERCRVIGAQLFKFDVSGFLHWGYNFYYTRFSKRLADPFAESDAGGKFPAGDSYVVYPGNDLEPLDSIRLHLFADAVSDLRALRLLESLAGREEAIRVLEEGLDSPLTFSEYPHSAKWLLQMRERVNERIAALTAQTK